MNKSKIRYFGDINLEQGGYFYTLQGLEWNYADVIRVTPCSDAGCQDNAWWIEHLTINIPTEPAKIENVISTCGYSVSDLPEDEESRAAMLIDACLAYGCYDRESSKTVQIGAEAEPCREPITPTKILRRNWTLSGYVKKHHLPSLRG